MTQVLCANCCKDLTERAKDKPKPKVPWGWPRYFCDSECLRQYNENQSK